VAEHWVVNASPLVLLAKCAQLHLLQRLCRELVVPAAVAVEIEAGPTNDPALLWIHGDGAGFKGSASSLDPRVTAWDLGAGETAVLSWACQHPNFTAIVDDRAARKCAEGLGIPVRGTVGILLLAKRNGLLAEVKPTLLRLSQAGLYLDPPLIARALQFVGEG
jgi:predicted nucleic acid-binding protein